MNLDHIGALQFTRNIRNSKHIAWKKIDRSFAGDASYMGGSHGLRGMDALVAATAAYYSVPLLTSDKEFKRIQGVIAVLTLDDL